MRAQAGPILLDSRSPQYAFLDVSFTTDPAGAIIRWDVLMFHMTPTGSNGPPQIRTGTNIGNFDNVTIPGFAAGFTSFTPGVWRLDPAAMTSYLLLTVAAMNIPLGASLTDHIIRIQNDITNKTGQACRALNDFTNHVQAQTGTNITTDRATIILAQVAKISLTIPCP